MNNQHYNLYSKSKFFGVSSRNIVLAACDHKEEKLGGQKEKYITLHFLV